jgi:hypothetical protein
MRFLLMGSLALFFASASYAQSQFSVSTDYLVFKGSETRISSSATLLASVKNEYKIEDSIWVSFAGSYSFSSDLHGFLNVSTKQKDASNNLKMLASLTNKEWSFRTRRGQFVGEFSQYVDDGSGVHQSEDVNTEYFSIDAQYGLFGIRYLDMAAPSVLEYPINIDVSELRVETSDGLDPDFSVNAYEIFFSYDGFQRNLASKTINPDWYFTGRAFFGLGVGTAVVSDTGKINYEAASGRELTSTHLDAQVIEMESKISLTRDISITSGIKASIAIGYSFNAMSYSAREDEDDFYGLEVSQNIIHHGPSFNFGMSY